MRALPIGVPKLIVSTLAAGDTRPYVGESDIAMLFPVVDIAGINRISERILTNAAAAIAGMAEGIGRFRPRDDGRPLVAATMFGVTTPCVSVARERLEALGYEVLVFHATGSAAARWKAWHAWSPGRRARHHDDRARGRARRRHPDRWP